MHTLALGAGGPGVLLLPANGKCAEFYEPLGRALAAHGTRVTLTTFAGFDGTPGRPGWDDLVAEARAALPGHRVLVGHSLGGLVALLVAAAEVDLDALVLLEPAVVPWSWAARLLGARYRRHEIDRIDRPGSGFENSGPWFRRLHDPVSFPREAMAIALRASDATPPEVTRHLHETADGLWPLPLARVRVPTLLVRGGSSGLLMALGQIALARHLRRAERATLPRAGHWMANEQDDALAEMVARFAGIG